MVDELKVFEGFSGVGSQRKALINLGLKFDVVATSDWNISATESYVAMYHGEPTCYSKGKPIEEIEQYLIKIGISSDGKNPLSEASILRMNEAKKRLVYDNFRTAKNMGSIVNLDPIDIPEHDLFTYSFPCQDISVAGYQEGLDEGSGTRSGLLWECRKVIKEKKPKYLLLENVKNLVSKKHKHNFDKWLGWLESEGYTNHWKVLNAKHFGIPQTRERVFVVSILGEQDGFVFNKGELGTPKLKEFLVDDVDEKYYLPKEIQDRLVYFPEDRLNTDEIEIIGTTAPNPRDSEGNLIFSKCTSAWVYNPEKMCGTLSARDYKQPKQILIKNATKKGYLVATEGDGIDISYPTSTTRRGRVQKEAVGTLQTSESMGTLKGNKIRKLTPQEYWRLMGFSDVDFLKAKSVTSDTQLYKQAGNSIVVNVLEAIFKEMFKDRLQGEQ